MRDLWLRLRTVWLKIKLAVLEALRDALRRR